MSNVTAPALISHMKTHAPEQFRMTLAEAIRLLLPTAYCSSEADGMNGMFHIRCGKEILRCMVSDGGGWEHVSVSLEYRCPTWDEMCFVKDIFWEPEECVIQYHPPASEYVNNHQFALHLWKPVGVSIPTPPSIMVGIKGLRLA